jgi:hypothetical protein
MRRTAVLVAAVFLASCLPAIAEKLTNESVLELQRLGLAEDLIIRKIQSSESSFDLSTDGLKQLKAGGVSDDIIRAMMGGTEPLKLTAKRSTPAVISNDPLAPHDDGLWLFQQTAEGSKMTRLIAKDAGRSSGWNKKTRATLYGASATLQVTGPLPTFYYYNSGETAEDDANDLALARMEVRAEKNDRRLAVGKEGFFGGKKSGLDPKAYVPVVVEKAAPGIFKVIPAQNLNRGEYCFIQGRVASREALKRGDVDLSTSV